MPDDVVETHDLFGLILKTQLESKDSIFHFIERNDGYIDCANTQRYFGSKEEWPANEQAVLEYAQSPVLDIGCGAGRHALHLQQQGLEVVGLDFSEGAVYVCKKRGLKKVILGSACNLPSFKQPFSTFLLLFNNFGICGDPANTITLLQNLYRLGTPNARILLSYADVSNTMNPFHLAFHKRNLAAGRRKGEITIRFRYQGYIGSWFTIWLPTRQEFQDTIQQTHWQIQMDLEKEGFHHVLLAKAEL
ncbi:MAG: class I SAM-dependent methyltransferase [Promethearchaeota archaeon]